METINRINETAREGGPPGAGAFVVYTTNEGEYCILGKRFGKVYKWSVGGAMEEGETNRDTFEREYEEEHFFMDHTNKKYLTLEDGFYYNSKLNYTTFHFSNCFFKTKEGIDNVVQQMNKMAGSATLVRKMLSGKMDYNSEVFISFLKYFGDYLRKETVDFLEKQIEKLENIVLDKNDKVLKDVGNFTEYSDFIVVPLEEYDPKVYFKHDRNAFDEIFILDNK